MPPRVSGRVAIVAKDKTLAVKPPRVASGTWTLVLEDQRANQGQVIEIEINGDDEDTVSKRHSITMRLCPGTYRFVPVIGGRRDLDQAKTLDVKGLPAPGC